MCEMEIGRPFTIPTHTFTVMNGDTLSHRNTSKDLGATHISKLFEENWGMCVQFGYYVKSSIRNKNGTTLSLTADGCYGTYLWSLPTPDYVCTKKHYCSVNQKETGEISVAFDAIEVGQCNALVPTTVFTSTSIDKHIDMK